MMPKETKQAVEWALEQLDTFDNHSLVDKVREYFNANGIVYGTFSYSDLTPYLHQDEQVKE